MSDTVTIHNGHCSYHGPADKAPVWAARVASTDHKISPAPTRSPMNSIAPVPAQTVAADAVPAPLTSFEDTSHAWEEGYRAGRAEGEEKAQAISLTAYARAAKAILSSKTVHEAGAALRALVPQDANDWLEAMVERRVEGRAKELAERNRELTAENKRLLQETRWTGKSEAGNPTAGDLISREAEGFDAAMKMLFALLDNPAEADIMRHAVENLLGSVTEARIRARSAAPIGKEIW